MLVPALGLALFGGYEAYERAVMASRAHEVEQRVTRASDLLELRITLADEAFAAGVLATGSQYGVGADVMSHLFHTDLVARRDRDRRTLDRLVRTLRDPGRLTTTFARLRALRAHLDRDPGDVDALLAGMSSIQTDVTNASTAALQDADDASFGDASSVALRRDLTVLRRADQAAIGVGVQLDAFGRLLAPSAPKDRAASLAYLREGIGILNAAETGIDGLATKPVLARWHAAAHDPASTRTAAEADLLASLAPPDLPSYDLARLGQIFTDGMRRLDLYDGLTEQVAGQARTEAARLYDDAIANLRLTVGVAGALVVLAFALAVAVARSIGRPLLELANRATRVSEGDLSGTPPSGRGPRELVAVSATMDEVVANLRLVESQVGALSEGRFDDETLAQPVPGRLGALLHASVARLSHSMEEREELARRLAFEATHDALTGLPNRTSALGVIAHAVARCRRAGRGVAVLHVHVDGVKRVSDRYGHDAGDRTLCVVAERILAAVRAGDVVARVGGDELAVVSEGIDDPRDVEHLATRLLDVVREPVALGAAVTRVSACVGVALGVDCTADPDALLRDAGLAAELASASGSGRVGWFDDAMLTELVRCADVEDQVRAALANGELVLHYQPVVTTACLRVGAEALVRWQRPDGELVPPGSFIPIAETSDLVIDIGRWALQRACEQLASWGAHEPGGHDAFHVSVNLSGRHLTSLTVVDDVQRALRERGVDPSRLVVEITETALVDDFALAADHLGRLRALGVRIAIDDFGTGYTSLAHLRHLPADIIKIDRSLIVAADGNPAATQILELVVGTAHALGTVVVAEGIETAEQLALVRALGCDHVQGYLTGRPVPVESFTADPVGTGA